MGLRSEAWLKFVKITTWIQKITKLFENNFFNDFSYKWKIWDRSIVVYHRVIQSSLFEEWFKATVFNDFGKVPDSNEPLIICSKFVKELRIALKGQCVKICQWFKIQIVSSRVLWSVELNCDSHQIISFTKKAGKFITFLYGKEFWVSVFFLGTGMMVEVLKQAGTWHDFSEELKMSVNTGDSWSAQCFRMDVEAV